MSLARTTYTKGTAGAVSSCTTPSFTPPNNSLLVIIPVAVDGGAGTLDGSTLTIADSLTTLTWTKRKVATFIGGSPTNFYPEMVVWTAPITVGASMTVTISTGSSTPLSWAVWPVAYTGHNVANPIGVTGATAIGSVGPADGAWNMALSGTSAPTSEVLAIGGGPVNGANDCFQTIGAGWTQLDTYNAAADAGMTLEVFAGATSVAAWADMLSPASTDSYYGAQTFGIAVEIKAAAAAGAANSRLYHNPKAFYAN